MFITPSELRKEIQKAFPSVKSWWCDYVELLDEKYLIPSYEESLELIEKYWEPIKNTPWVRNVGDCDNRAIKLYSDVHWHRVLNLKEIPEEKRIQWSLGFASGLNPFGNMHTFNLIRNDKGLFIFDNRIKKIENYTPISVRF